MKKLYYQLNDTIELIIIFDDSTKSRNEFSINNMTYLYRNCLFIFKLSTVYYCTIN